MLWFLENQNSSNVSLLLYGVTIKVTTPWPVTNYWHLSLRFKKNLLATIKAGNSADGAPWKTKNRRRRIWSRVATLPLSRTKAGPQSDWDPLPTGQQPCTHIADTTIKASFDPGRQKIAYAVGQCWTKERWGDGSSTHTAKGMQEGTGASMRCWSFGDRPWVGAVRGLSDVR